MRIRYTTTFVGTCPVDGTDDIYELEVSTGQMIHVEAINAAVSRATRTPQTQEAITAQIASELLGAAVKTHGRHSGVKVVVEC